MRDQFPIRKRALHKRIVPGVWEATGGLIVKRGSALREARPKSLEFYSSDYEGTAEERRRKAVEDAKLHAGVYARLAREGFYPPKSLFMIGESKRGNPEIIAVMPALDILGERIHYDEEKVEAKQRIALKYATREHLHGDLGKPSNWGGDNGQVYYHDLH
ncbi:MAG: hypothetical protein AB1626_03160, partial [Candidatus Micrarchaeota archaeon]